MVSRRSGHVIEVNRPRHDRKKRQEWVEVYGRKISRTVEPSAFWDGKLGWRQMSREMPKRKAVRIAKEYKKAGFLTRVVRLDNNGDRVVVETFKVGRSRA